MAIHYDENLYKTWTMSPPLMIHTVNLAHLPQLMQLIAKSAACVSPETAQVYGGNRKSAHGPRAIACTGLILCVKAGTWNILMRLSRGGDASKLKHNVPSHDTVHGHDSQPDSSELIHKFLNR